MIFLLPFVFGGVGGDCLLVVIACSLGLMVSMEVAEHRSIRPAGGAHEGMF